MRRLSTVAAFLLLSTLAGQAQPPDAKGTGKGAFKGGGGYAPKNLQVLDQTRLPYGRGSVNLNGHTFDDAGGRGGLVNLCQPESGAGKQITIFIAGAFAATGNYQHFQIEKLAERGLIAGSDDNFYNQKPP